MCFTALLYFVFPYTICETSCLLLSVVVSESRVVKVPVGPLVHVEGQVVSIRCNVSDYEGPRDQDFEWSMVLAGDKLLQLISTFDSDFTDPTVKDRLNSGDISYKKLADNAVELIFKKVRVTDSGLYRCSTPSTDSVVKGNYYADVELKGESSLCLPARCARLDVFTEQKQVYLFILCSIWEEDFNSLAPSARPK